MAIGNQQVVAGTVMGVGVTSFAQPVVDRDGRVYTDKGLATDWMFVEWPDKISPKSLPAAIGVVEGVVRGVLDATNARRPISFSHCCMVNGAGRVDIVLFFV